MYSVRRRFFAHYAKTAFGGSSSHSGLEGILSSYCFGGDGGTLGVQQGRERRHYSSRGQWQNRRNFRVMSMEMGPGPQQQQPLQRQRPKLEGGDLFRSRHHLQFRDSSSQSPGKVLQDEAAHSTSSKNSEEDKAKGQADEQKWEESEKQDGDDGGTGDDNVDDIEGFDEDEGGALALTEEQLQELGNGDPELIKKIKYCQLEYEVFREEGGQVPSRPLKQKHWEELLSLDSRTRRRKFFLFLFKVEMKQLSAIRKKERKRQERLEEYAENPLPSREEDVYGMFYTLARNTLFLRLYDTTVNKFHNQRVCSAIGHHPPLILDCSYDEFMNPREAKNTAKQLELVIAENRVHKEPFNLYLCNAERHTKTMRCLQRVIPVLDDDSFIINIHEGCFTDIFPKKNLVYLTPHTRDVLEEYDEDDIYIIGAMVDKSSPRPYSLAKAKKLGIRMRSLPLDKHLMWGLGGKSLTLNQVVRIMLDVRYTRGDWKEGLKSVPMRKLCRDFHPYPDQVDGQREIASSGVSPYRKEKMSSVFKDHELLNRRKGFRRSDMYTPDNYGSNSGNSRSRLNAPRMKSLLQDD